MIKKGLSKIKKRVKGFFEKQKARTDYGKFVIITRSRTGSNLLISLLDSHDNIEAHGELFRRLEGKSCQTIYDGLFPKKSSKQIGFKIFYYHPLDSEDRSIWDLLKNDPHLKVIHLRRENLLRVHISRLIAGQTDVWSSRNKQEISLADRKVHIDVKELLQDFETTNQQIAAAKETFKSHQSIDVSYEELTADRANTMQRILGFLGVTQSNLDSVLKRQNPETLEDLVANYEEVYDALIDTDHAFMLKG
ncbi:MAG: sulfotransferase [Flavobacteriaceae bacterium]|nr:sulfotransferase [Flavobacteriaceae bacterium]